MTTATQTHPLFGSTIISRYTRAQAIEDGILVDITENAMRCPILAKIGVCVAIECDAWERVMTFSQDGDANASLDLAFALGLAIHDCLANKTGGNTVMFGFKAWSIDTDETDEFSLVGTCHPGDDGERVFTISLAA